MNNVNYIRVTDKHKSEQTNKKKKNKIFKQKNENRKIHSILFCLFKVLAKSMYF